MYIQLLWCSADNCGSVLCKKKNTRKGIKVEGNRIGGRLGMGSRRREGRKLASKVGRNVEKLRKV